MKIKFSGKIGKNCLNFISNHNLITKWDKQKKLFEENIKHPSLRVKILEPKSRGVYSFRIDKKYRALFTVKDNKAYIFRITNHYD